MPSVTYRRVSSRARLLTRVNAGPALADYKDHRSLARRGYQPATTALCPSRPRDDEGFMLVRIKAMVASVGEAEELVDIRRTHKIGPVIGALIKEIERAHPGVSLLEHVLTVESKPSKAKPDETVIIR
jgi:hypothetical protein